MEDWQLNQSPSSTTQSAFGRNGWGRGPSQNRYLRALADALIEGGEAQRPALAKRLGVSKQAVSELMANLEMRGMVQVRGQLGGLPGRSDLSYTLRPGAALAIGFDIAGGTVSAVIIDLRGALLAEASETLAGHDLKALTDQFARLAERLCRDSELQRFLVQAGIVVISTGVMPWLDRTELPVRLGPAMGCPISVKQNEDLVYGDASLAGAAALAQRHLLTELFGPDSPSNGTVGAAARRPEATAAAPAEK